LTVEAREVKVEATREKIPGASESAMMSCYSAVSCEMKGRLAQGWLLDLSLLRRLMLLRSGRFRVNTLLHTS
jgi:hypothetical protein